VLIENPAFVGSLSAEKNLLSLAALRGIPASRVGQVLKQVGLAGREHEPVRSFSLGMKQRLGIASALLTSPDLLILDEPTNGLDPAGIVEIRGLLKTLAKEGRTVVVSSHLLSELESICDHLVIIRFGKVLFNGPMSQMLERTGAYIDIDTERDADRSALAKALKAAGWKVDVTADGLRVHAAKNRSAELNRFASEAKITLVRIAVAQESLEDLFLEMTGRTDGELAESRAAVKGRNK
jgi:ABC-2 type transport system ATP-binding protein